MNIIWLAMGSLALVLILVVIARRRRAAGKPPATDRDKNRPPEDIYPLW